MCVSGGMTEPQLLQRRMALWISPRTYMAVSAINVN